MQEKVDQLNRLRPYDDAWGVLHDPTTEWDVLLKYYKSWVMFIQIGEGSRRMCRAASSEVEVIIHREEQQHHRQKMAKIRALEAEDLERVSRSKEWKRRKRRKVEAKKQSVEQALSTEP